MFASRPHRGRVGLVLALAALAALLLTGLAWAVNPGTKKTTTGQNLTVRIDAPTNGGTVPLADLAVSGFAGLGTGGAGGSGPANLMYVVDNSGSTSSDAGATGPGDCNGDGTVDAGDDVNGDSSQGTVLDCEISGVVALNTSLRTTGIPIAEVVFGSDADLADMAPGDGQQDFAGVADDANANGVRDPEDVVRSIGFSGFNLFSVTNNSGGGTDFDNALKKVVLGFATKPGQRNIVAFLSDGESSVDTSGGSPLDQAKTAGIRINTYSVGNGAAGCKIENDSSLRKIADATGGSCIEVTDPTKLTGTISGAAGTGIKSLTVRANGKAPIATPLNALGDWSTVIPKAQLRKGSNSIVATVTANDGTTASADIIVNIGASTAVTIPAAKKCLSRRLFPIRIRQIPGLTYASARITLNGKKVPIFVEQRKKLVRVPSLGRKQLKVKTYNAWIDLRGLPKGSYTVKIVVTTTSGSTVTGTRTYRTCTKRLPFGKIKL